MVEYEFRVIHFTSIGISNGIKIIVSECIFMIDHLETLDLMIYLELSQ